MRLCVCERERERLREWGRKVFALDEENKTKCDFMPILLFLKSGKNHIVINNDVGRLCENFNRSDNETKHYHILQQNTYEFQLRPVTFI